MPHINITASATGSNTGSCGQLVDYLEKENKPLLSSQQELWFNQERQDIRPYEVRQGIDCNTAKLKSTEAKFYLVNISPSQKELQHLNNDPEKLKAYARAVMTEYASNFQKGLVAEDVKWYGKVEYNRSYKWTDVEVKGGQQPRGGSKPGLQMHIQIIVSRKDSNNQRLLSPLTNHRGQGKSESHGKKFGQFNRVNFKERCEKVFDQQFDYKRNLEDTFRYRNLMANGTTIERVNLSLEIQTQSILRQEQQHLKQLQGQKVVEQERRSLEIEVKKEQNLDIQEKRNKGMRL